MKRKRFGGLFSVMFAFLIIMSMSSVLAGPAVATLILPEANGNYSTTMTLNVTTTMTVPLNASFYSNSSGGAIDTSVAPLVTLINITTSDVEFFSSAQSISALSDAATYNWTVIIENATDQVTSPSNSIVTIDNTAPACTSSKSGQAFPDQFGSQTFACTCTDTIDSGLTISRILYKPSSTTFTISSSPETVTGGNLNEFGRYTMSCDSTDYTGNNGASSNISVSVGSSSSGGEVLGQPGSGNGMSVLLIAVILGGVGAVVSVLAMTKKKRKKKRR